MMSLMLVCFCGCATVSHTGRSQLMMVSEDTEVSMGNDAWRQILSTQRQSSDPAMNATVKRVGANIVKALGQSGTKYTWEFKVLESPEANAFALPGGKVAVYSGMFKHVSGDAELAAVIGHEIGHVMARHGAERMSHDMAAQTGGIIVSTVLRQSGSSQMDLWLQAYGVAANVGAILPYSREHEYEADYLGMIYMAKAGYNPNAALSFWNKFADSKQESALAEFLSTHPMGSHRVAEMKRRMPEAMSHYNKSRKQ